LSEKFCLRRITPNLARIDGIRVPKLRFRDKNSIYVGLEVIWRGYEESFT